MKTFIIIFNDGERTNVKAEKAYEEGVNRVVFTINAEPVGVFLYDKIIGWFEYHE